MQKGLLSLFAIGFLFAASISNYCQKIDHLNTSVISTVEVLGPMEVQPERANATPTPPPRADPASSPTPKLKSLERQFFKNLARDQWAIWTSPFRVAEGDAKWLAPLAAATGALIATDRRTSAWVSRHGSLPGFSGSVSRIGSNEVQAAIIGAIYVTGRVTGNERARETGVLAAQALINTKLTTWALKAATQRPRPNFDDGRGRFFRGGSSFPSGHATSSLAIATVISYEYQHIPIVRYGSLITAVAITLSRYSGRNHFFSDLLVGGAIGFLTGRYVYHKHHRPHPASKDDADISPNTMTRRGPEIIPILDSRYGTYGAKLVWEL